MAGIALSFTGHPDPFPPCSTWTWCRQWCNAGALQCLALMAG